MSRKEDLHDLQVNFSIQTRLWASEWNKNDTNGISLTHVSILSILSDEGPKQAKDLIQLLYITSGGITVVTNKLVELQLIKRRREEDGDRRAVYFEITDEGRKVLITAMQQRDEQIERFYKSLSDEEIHELRRIYNKLLDNLLYRNQNQK